MRKILALVVTAVVTTGVAVFAPAAAQAASCSGGASTCVGSTNVTFAITGGSLNLTVPSSVDFTNGGATSFAASGLTSSFSPTWPATSPVKVDDYRLVTLGWTDTLSGLPSWSGTGTNTMSTAGSTISMNCGTQSGISTLSLPTGVSVTTGGVLMAATVVTGNNSVSCVPNLTVFVPATATADTYKGTLTQTVA